MSEYADYPISESLLHYGFNVYYRKDSYATNVYLHHHEFYEAYLLINGELDYIIDGKKYKLSQGNMLLIQPNQLHQPIFENLDQRYERYVFWIKKSFIENRLFFKNISEDSTYIANVTQVDKNAIIALSNLYLSSRSKREEDANDSGIENKTLDLLCEIFDRLFSDCKPAKYQPMHMGLKAVIEYIDDNIEKPISLEELSAISFISKYHLSRKFKQKTGVSIYQYCLKKRLLLAKNLIKNNIPMAEVYLKCGFTDYSSFYRAFTKEYHTSPQKYLKSFHESFR